MNQTDRNQLIENVQWIIKSAFWIAVNLFVYEGIIKLNDIHPVSAAVCWLVILVLCLVCLFLLIRGQRTRISDRLLLFGALLWSSCGAIIKAMFGIIGLAVYITVLFVISLIMLFTGNRQG